MSKIALEGNASGTGTFTIASPNSNSNYTLTLPTESGTVLTNNGNQAGTFSTLTVNSNNISADNSLGFRNRIINGDMRIDQRYAGTATANTINGYAVDRWSVSQSTSGKIIAQQNAGSVTPPTGFANYLGITSQSAYSVGSNDYYLIGQAIEGYNIADLAWGTANAKTVIVSFWVRSSLTGTFGGSFGNNGTARSYLFTYTISAANTWEYKTVTIAGDTSGTWEKTTSTGLNVRFGLGVGSTYSGTAGSWSGSTYFSATGATSVVGTNGATFYITGVQLEVGSTATPFERRPYGTELALCQRYFEKSYNVSTALGASPTAYGYELFCPAATTEYRSTRLKVNKRATATVTIYSPHDGATGIARDFAADTNKTATVSDIGETGFRVEISSTVVGNRTAYHWAASAEL